MTEEVEDEGYAGEEEEKDVGRATKDARPMKRVRATYMRSCHHLTAALRDGVAGGTLEESVARAAEFTFLCKSARVVSSHHKVVRKLHPWCIVCGFDDVQREDTRTLHVCLFCVFWCCMDHIASHVTTSSHSLWLNLDIMTVFCWLCDRLVYDSVLEEEIENQRDLAHRSWERFLSEHGTFEKSSSRRELLFATSHPMHPRCPGLTQERRTSLIQEHSLPLEPTRSGNRCDLLGLFNLGNTCYMNSVLQALLYTPPLRNFYLADLHRPFCRSLEPCLSCAMDDLIVNSYKPKDSRQFLIPNKFMDIIWRNADMLATYAQHDAHEFLIAALNMLQIHTGPLSRCGIESDFASESVIEQIFLGKLRSDVICQTCGNSSPTSENFFDISVDVEVPDVRGPRSAGSRVVTGHNTGREATSSGARGEEEPFVCSLDSETREGHDGLSSIVSLLDCLSRFTQPEVLGQGNKMHCEVCGGRQEAYKQLSLKTLPTVLSIHLKRFEHVGGAGNSRKIDVPIQFPNELDISPFTTTSVLRRRKAQVEISSRTEHAPFEKEANKTITVHATSAQAGPKPPAAVGENLPDASMVSVQEPHASAPLPSELDDPVEEDYTTAGLAQEPGVSPMEGVQGGSTQEAADQLLAEVNVRPSAEDVNEMSPARRTKMTRTTGAVEDRHADTRCSSYRGIRDRVILTRPIYELYAVVNHIGKIDRGHYTTLIRRGHLWFRCDDDKVTFEPKVGPSVSSSEAYILFYVRRDADGGSRGSDPR